MSREPDFSLSENHRRTITTTLSMIDEMLCDFEQGVEGGDRRSVLFHQFSSLSPRAVDEIRAEASEIRAMMEDMRDDLHLVGQERDVAVATWSRAAVLWVNLCQLESRRLKAYGEVPDDVAAYLDPRIRELNERLTRIANAARGRPDDASGGTVAPDTDSRE